MAKTGKPRLWLRIIVPGKGAIGPGKIDLLRAVERERSIAAAARSLRMSYRRAWLLIDDTSKVAGRALVATRAGGAAGGGARLTPAGRDLIATYDRICAAAERATLREMTVFGGRKAP